MFMPTVHAFSLEGAPERYAIAAREMGVASSELDEAKAGKALVRAAGAQRQAVWLCTIAALIAESLPTREVRCAIRSDNRSS
jgi:alcohol dehydrogenase class IV